MEIGDRRGEAADYGNLGIISGQCGEYAKTQKYYKKALALYSEMGPREEVVS